MGPCCILVLLSGCACNEWRILAPSQLGCIKLNLIFQLTWLIDMVDLDTWHLTSVRDVDVPLSDWSHNLWHISDVAVHSRELCYTTGTRPFSSQ
jgi:hypothetical protein